MKTKLIALLLILGACANPIFAQITIKTGDLCYYIDTAKHTATVTYQSVRWESVSTWVTEEYYNDSVSIQDAIIPSSIEYEGENYIVTRIGNNAFRSCTSLLSVTIPNSVTSIGSDAFSGCTNLTSVTIPDSITYIGNMAFSSCDVLKKVNISDLAAWCKIAFTNWGSNPLCYAKHLYLNGAEITDLVIPHSVTSINEYTFCGWAGLTSVTIHNEVTSIKRDAFSGCTGLTSIEIPNGVTSIGSDAFSDCTGLTSIELPNSVTSIGPGAFQRCTSLNSINIPKGVTSIGDGVFSNCNSLTSVTIGNSVTSIGYGAFEKCGISKIYYEGDISNWLLKAWKPYEISSSYSLYIQGVLINDLTIPNTVANIGSRVFYGCNSLTSVVIPNSVTCIGSGAFFKCSNLTSVTFPNSLTSIQDSTFHSCNNLISVEFSNSVTSIGNSAFLGCTSLTSIEIPNSVRSIGASAFNNCNRLTSITLGCGVSSIGNYCFNYCRSLNSVIWNAKNYPDCTNTQTPFYYKPSSSSASYDMRPQITSFVFGQDVEHIPSYICSGMTNIEKLSIGGNVKSIGGNAFQNINSRKLRKIILPAVQTIGNSAFNGCSYIETIDFGANIESIGAYAFKGCTRVATMTCLADITPEVGTDGLISISDQAELYVLKNCVQKYKVDENWNRFIIKEMAADNTDVTELAVIPDENTANVVWPSVSGAATYEMIIKDKDGNVICTLIFDANGQLTSIAFKAPGHNNAPQQTQQAGFAFTITGLDSGTGYDLTMTSKSSSGQVLQTKTISFRTNGLEPIENIFVEGDKPVKVLHDGQIYILRGEKIYTLQGQEVK